MTDLPWKMGATFSGHSNAAPHPLDVTFRLDATGPVHTLFRKCCGCMYVRDDVSLGVPKGTPVEFICGCGSHPSVMVCDGKVIGTSA